MPDNKNKIQSTPPAEQSPQPLAKNNAKFPVEAHRQNCRELYGISEAAFNAATFGLKGSFTIEEVRNKITKFKEKPARKKKKDGGN